MAKLTPKQEKFCLVYLKTGNATEAYRQSYNCKKWKPSTRPRRTMKKELQSGRQNAPHNHTAHHLEMVRLFAERGRKWINQT